MPRKTFAALLPFLAVLALALPGTAVAGPPEGVSGKMVLDEVADGLRKYRKEKNITKRINWLIRLASTRDPRVAVALGEAVAPLKNPECTRDIGCEVREGVIAAYCLVEFHYASNLPARPDIESIQRWWRANEADLRRRAKQLPQ